MLRDLLHYDTEFERWRYAYAGGRPFVDKYLEKLSSKEDEDDFAIRKRLSYCPSFAAEAVDEVKDAIIHRAPDIVRVGGAASFRKAITGLDRGVDLKGSSMSMYMADQILPELLPMEQVGVLVDNFRDLGITEKDKQNKHPYYTRFERENIIALYPEVPIDGYERVLLRETVCLKVDDFGRPDISQERHRYYEKTPSGIRVIIGNLVGSEWKDSEEYFLNIPEIPFHLFKIRRSLMKDVADYQIALLNIESSDVSFIRCANFPIFYEYYKSRGGDYTKTGEIAGDKEITIGAGQGRRYPDQLNAPGFINPDPETLRASMEKGAQLKKDIRALVRLNLSMLDPQRQSADSKGYDERSLESGLSQIGTVLQTGEQELARFWSMFEGDTSVIKIAYPKTYDLQNDATRLDLSSKLKDLANSVPSDTFQREVKKMLTNKLIGHLIPKATLDTIHKEIDAADATSADPQVVLAAHKEGLVSDVDAAVALGFSKESVEQAKKDRADRLALIAASQGGLEKADANRGVPEKGEGKEEPKPPRGKEQLGGAE